MYPWNPDPNSDKNSGDFLKTHSTVRIEIGALINAPLIPAGFWSFLRNPVESGGIKFGRDTSQNDIPGDKYSGGMMSFLISHWNGQKGMVLECNNRNTDY